MCTGVDLSSHSMAVHCKVTRHACALGIAALQTQSASLVLSPSLDRNQSSKQVQGWRSLDMAIASQSVCHWELLLAACVEDAVEWVHKWLQCYLHECSLPFLLVETCKPVMLIGCMRSWGLTGVVYAGPFICFLSAGAQDYR